MSALADKIMRAYLAKERKAAERKSRESLEKIKNNPNVSRIARELSAPSSPIPTRSQQRKSAALLERFPNLKRIQKAN